MRYTARTRLEDLQLKFIQDNSVYYSAHLRKSDVSSRENAATADNCRQDTPDSVLCTVISGASSGPVKTYSAHVSGWVGA